MVRALTPLEQAWWGMDYHYRAPIGEIRGLVLHVGPDGAAQLFLQHFFRLTEEQQLGALAPLLAAALTCAVELDERAKAAAG